MSEMELLTTFILIGVIFRSDLARSYKSKMSEMELKQVELMRLSQDFETKMRQKEVNVKHKLPCSVFIKKFNFLENLNPSRQD